MNLPTTPEIDRPDHLHTKEDLGDAEPVKEKQLADEGLLQKLREAGWELSGDSAKNPKTGTKISLGDLLTPTQAREANATLGNAPTAQAQTAPAPQAGKPGGGGHGGGGDAPAAGAPAGDASPGRPTPQGEKFAKNDVIDQSFMDQARQAGWDVQGDVAKSPSGETFELGEHMTFEQARTANRAGLRNTDGNQETGSASSKLPPQQLVIQVNADQPNPVSA